MALVSLRAALSGHRATSLHWSAANSLPLGRRHASTHHVLDTLSQRGLVHQVSAPNSLRSHLSSESPRSVYVGVDPSAESLHVGNLLPLLAALHFVRHGHKAVVLIGGATGSIGDPSGRDTERQALSPSTLAHNVSCITQQVHDFFASASAFAAKHDVATNASDLRTRVSVVNNADWYRDVNVLAFLRDVGRHARVTNMLARDSVKSRLQPAEAGQAAAGLSFTEFSYQLLQAHDFSVLHSPPWSCTIQLGGSDQMGNIMAGVDLIRRQKFASAAETGEVVENDDDSAAQPAYGLTLPLLTTASGAKFGKSAGNAVWLDAHKCSHYDFYQYFYRTRDSDVATYLKTLTLLPVEEVERIVEQHNQRPSARYAQQQLSSHLTELVRGERALQQANLASRILFDTTLDDLHTDLVVDAFANDPRLHVLPRKDVDGVKLTQLLRQVGLCKSTSEARRVITNGGVYINNVAVRGDAGTMTLSSDDIIPNTNILILRLGRTEHAVVHVQ